MKADERRAMAAALALSRRARFVYVTTNGAGGYPNTRVVFNLLRFRAKAGTMVHHYGRRRRCPAAPAADRLGRTCRYLLAFVG